MRRYIIAVAACLMLAATARSASAQVSAAAVPADTVREALRAFSLSRDGVELNGRFSRGSVVVEAGDSVAGPVVTFGGNADIHGIVTGGVYALWGNVTIHPGADVLGGAGAYHGRVILDGGRVRGTLESWPAAVAAAEVQESAPMTVASALRLAAGWTGVAIILGLIVLVLASTNLEATARVLEQDFGRAFFVGVMGQLGFLPLLLLAVVALAITVVGILLVPFLLVAAPIAYAGFVTLGWLALALLSGRALLRSRDDAGSRAEAVRALLVGVLLLMVPWFIVAGLQGTGSVGLGIRLVAIGVSWVASTAGLGATILSRAGSGKALRREKPQPPSQGWATPTPVAGVAAARRPIPARPGATPK
ncbi:MAG: bactofilin family protein [Gemmatimonadaceae bacterium]